MRALRLSHGGLLYFARLEDDATARLLTAAPWEGGIDTDRLVPYRGPRLPPVTPSKIVCVGRNYHAHAKELGNEVPKEPLIFLKPPTALIGDGEAIELPPASERVEHEGELGVVIGSRMRDVGLAEAAKGIFGYTCINDVTARDIQRKDVQFTRGKGFDTFCPCGPWIETDTTHEARSVTVRVNGATKQSGNTRDMIWSVPQLLSFISSVMTLLPGDLVSTGTPEGVGPLVAGDEVEVAIDAIGTLRNPITPRKVD